MRALVCLLLMTAPALAAPGCYEQNAAGDKLIFTSDPAELIYTHKGVTADCSYGIDGDSGDPTIICDRGLLKSTVVAADQHQVIIAGHRWSYQCPDATGL